MSAAIVQFLPEVLDVNGDAQNALVLAQRARWSGIDADLVAVRAGDAVPERPALVVLGSSVDGELPGIRSALEPFASAIFDWVEAGVPVLAVGTGLELLTDGIDVLGGIDGFGVVPGRATPLPTRATTDLVIDAAEGRLIGFENHARGLRDIREPLGAVVSGLGNGDGTDGVRVRGLVGTHLHGPVLAKNPVLADSMLRAAFGDAYRPDDERIRFVDETARAARQRIAGRLGLDLRPTT